VKRARSRKQAQLALGAALAGILAGSTLALAAPAHSETGPVLASSDADGCNGPNGCGGEKGGDEGGKEEAPKAAS